ncbi:MAG TPA: RNA-binding cell elongation regulator Jag/EloR [Gaiellaceae bacterium]|nr:RNA-binding cell elongation regulator Jag/EloR [Gaiellaceae bacterium]
MRSVETEGGSIDEAIQRALETLRVPREQVEIEILENAMRGLFGIGSRRARVRATVRQSLEATIGATADGGVPRVSRETSPPSDRAASAGSREAAVVRAREVLEAILGYLVDGPQIIEEVAGSSQGTEADGMIHLSLSASDSGMIIGRRGQTLDAMEHLVSRIVFRDDGERGLRIALDVEGYRQRREESLRELAHRLAGKAKETGAVVTLNPLSPRDRRIVHLALQADPDVTTVSQGEGSYRRLLITPRGKRPGRERNRWR